MLVFAFTAATIMFMLGNSEKVNSVLNQTPGWASIVFDFCSGASARRKLPSWAVSHFHQKRRHKNPDMWEDWQGQVLFSYNSEEGVYEKCSFIRVPLRVCLLSCSASLVTTFRFWLFKVTLPNCLVGETDNLISRQALLQFDRVFLMIRTLFTKCVEHVPFKLPV